MKFCREKKKSKQIAPHGNLCQDFGEDIFLHFPYGVQVGALETSWGCPLAPLSLIQEWLAIQLGMT